MRFTMAIAGMVVLSLFLANLVFQYAGKGQTDREFSLFAYQRASWLAGELESRLGADSADKATQTFLSRSAREMDLSIVLLREADDPLVTAHGPSLSLMLRTLEDHPELGRHTDLGETPWEPAFDGSTDRARYPDRSGRPVRVQEEWPYAVEAPVRSNMTLRVVPLAQARLGKGAFGRGLMGIGMILLLVSALVAGRVCAPIDALAGEAASVARGAAGARVGRQPFDEAQKIAVAVNAMSQRAERAAADRKALIATVAGAFSGPVQDLWDLSEALDFEAVPPPLRPDIDAMRDDVADLLDVVENMEHWSQLETGRVSLDPKDVDIRHLLEEVCGDLAAEFAFDIDDDIDDLVSADPAWLRVLLRQIMINAVTHGRGPVEVSAARGHTKIEINVRDHGDGVADFDDLRRMFGAFFRREEGGLGLGLTVAQQVVELHRGGLTARNHPDGGLEIRLWLPAPPIRISEPDRSMDSADWEAEGDNPPAVLKPTQLGPGTPTLAVRAETGPAPSPGAESGEDDGVGDPYAPF